MSSSRLRKLAAHVIRFNKCFYHRFFPFNYTTIKHMIFFLYETFVLKVRNPRQACGARIVKVDH